MELGKIINNIDNNLRTLGRMIGYHSTNTYNSLVQNEVLSKPIGVASKSYNFLKEILSKNIGNDTHKFDGYGTPIGKMSDPYMNLTSEPWFIEDKEKQRYDNYLSYIGETYFHGKMTPPNFHNMKQQVSLYDYNKFITEDGFVGAIRQYKLDNLLSTNLLIPNGATNANGMNDTKLGVLNNFYLNSTLYSTLSKNQRGTSYSNPSYGLKGDDDVKSFSITQGGYSKFGLTGDFGLENGTYFGTQDMVAKQSLFTDEIIKNESGESYGNVHNINYSLGLIKASGSKTQEFIAKSIYGYDLLSDYNPSLKFSEGDKINYPLLTKKKYFASIDSVGSTYIDKITNDVVGYESNSEKEYIRLRFETVGNDNINARGQYLMYSEAEGNVENTEPKLKAATANRGVAFGGYMIYDQQNTNKNDIIHYTNEQFKCNKYKTLIARFHTDEYGVNGDVKDITSTANSKYGLSRGRNLLKKDFSNDSPYSDPYCRVWTYHKQYESLKDTIRPFKNLADLDKAVKPYQINREHLRKYTVLDTNGMVKFAPYESNVENIKKCMFSIENLAWKNSNVSLKPNEKGPLGGRIMWFPPYGLTFNESTSANWNSAQFIGRGESIYTYVNTERSGNLSFTLLMDHPSIINSQRNKIDSDGGVDDINSAEQTLLRFFAGCEILDENTVNNNDIQTNGLNETLNPTHIQMNSTIPTEDIVFFVFFPNYYSGIDEVNDRNARGAIQYLLYGLGSQLPVTDSYASFSFNGEGVGGYEMQEKLGLSVISNWSKPSSVITTGVDSNTMGDLSVYAIESVSENGKKQYWGYDCDIDYRRRILSDDNNYLDTKSFKLNSDIDKSLVASYYNDININNLYNFNNIYVALSKENISLKNVDEVSKVERLLNSYEVLGVEVYGFASSHGNEQDNNKLADNRAKTVKYWLKEYIDDNKIRTFVGEAPKILNSSDINSLEAKITRCCKVVIKLSKEKVTSRIDGGDNITYSDNVNVGIESVPENESLTYISNKNSLNGIKNEGISGSSNKTSLNEYEYFKKLQIDQPFLHNKLVDKIKYFDPAFHSITPEGFQSRLTFLNQCTRQGGTISSSNLSNVNNAYNLAFGAPPICVLRIGDFYDTKIIIDSLQINFDETSWDLNDEGIGVMPMMANISLGFKFIGGSDLGGPISKLQNAVSFNYYANTKVYDDRADKVDYRNGEAIYNSENI